MPSFKLFKDLLGTQSLLCHDQKHKLATFFQTIKILNNHIFAFKVPYYVQLTLPLFLTNRGRGTKQINSKKLTLSYMSSDDKSI